MRYSLLERELYARIFESPVCHLHYGTSSSANVFKPLSISIIASSVGSDTANPNHVKIKAQTARGFQDSPPTCCCTQERSIDGRPASGLEGAGKAKEGLGTLIEGDRWPLKSSPIVKGGRCARRRVEPFMSRAAFVEVVEVAVREGAAGKEGAKIPETGLKEQCCKLNCLAVGGTPWERQQRKVSALDGTKIFRF